MKQLQKTLRKHRTFIVFSICFLTLGIFIGQYIVIFPYLELDPKVDILNVAQLCTTILLGVWVANKLESNKVEKELLLKQVDGIWGMVNETQKKISTGQISYSEAASSFKRVNLSYKNLKETLDICNLTIEKKDWDSIHRLTNRLKNLITNTPQIAKAQLVATTLPLSVVNGIINFHQTRIDEIDQEYDNLKHLIVRLQITINKA